MGWGPRAVLKDLGLRRASIHLMPDAVAYAWYRLKATRRSESSYLLTVLLLVAALGGLSMGAIAAARSTESSYSDYVAASHVPQLFVLDGVINPAIGLNSAYNPALLHALAHLPHVVHVASEVELNMGPLTAGNHPEPNTSSISAEASIGGADFSEDPLTMTLGRMPDPHKADEFAMDAAAAKQLGYHLGQVVRMGWASNAQETSGDTPASFVVPSRPACGRQAGRHRRRAGDHAVPRRGRGQRLGYDHAVHAGPHRQAARVL